MIESDAAIALNPLNAARTRHIDNRYKWIINRVQMTIVQLGEKAKDQKEREERDSRNQEYAGSSYHVPDVTDLGTADDDELSGLSWGGISMRHVVARGHESESRRGSGRDDYPRDEARYQASSSGYYTQQQQHQTGGSYGSHDSSGGDDRYLEINIGGRMPM
ncbi:Uu.00g137180.m01.CDS01 [Anthostomella pinea]|uniref:Uu.00g137180.m01.CDS01 n=1 Tax=Anthostomella pinea TaxID=933095 RepID=A0AAI8VPH9_9PEZI|nr:Uu.00g137180.m01.CDS01 [Anthostomella pinea]